MRVLFSRKKSVSRDSFKSLNNAELTPNRSAVPADLYNGFNLVVRQDA